MERYSTGGRIYVLRYYVMTELLEVVGRAMDSTRLDPIWHLLKLRHLPALYSPAGKVRPSSLEWKIEVAKDSMQVGLDPRNLVAASVVWGQGASSSRDRPPTLAAAAAAAPGDPAQQPEPPQYSAQSTRNLTKIPRVRCQIQFNWPIVAQMNLSGLQAATVGFQPGSFGWSHDGVSLDGENVNMAVFFLPAVKQIVYGPPGVPGETDCKLILLHAQAAAARAYADAPSIRASPAPATCDAMGGTIPCAQRAGRLPFTLAVRVHCPRSANLAEARARALHERS
jgi:hypothetical protein